MHECTFSIVHDKIDISDIHKELNFVESSNKNSRKNITTAFLVSWSLYIFYASS